MSDDAERRDEDTPPVTATHVAERKRRLYIVDGSSYVFRAYFASPPLSTRDGIPTNAVLVFTNMLLALVREHDPELLAVAFDPPGKTFRHERFADYKANRKERPQELTAQFPHIKQIVEGLSICGLEVDGFEADDVIATLAERACSAGIDVTIVSGDKDLMQLVDDARCVRMLDTMGRMDRIFTIGEVVEKYGVGPDRLADVLALAGDASDNVPGIPGIGAKTAGKLVAEFGSLEGVLASVDQISGAKRKENLTNFADQARLSLELVTLRRDVPLGIELEDLEIGEPDLETLLPLFGQLEMHRLAAEIGQRAEALQIMPSAVEYADEAVDHEWLTVLKDSELKIVLSLLDEHEHFGLSLLTTEDDPMLARIVGIGLSWKPHAAAYVPVAHRTLTSPKQLELEHVLETLRSRLESRDTPKVCHDYKWHRILLARHGVKLEGVVCDTQLASYLLDPSRRSHSIDALAREIFEHEPRSIKELLGSGRTKRRVDQLDVDEVTDYGAERADLTLALCGQMMPLVGQRDLAELHDELELPLARVLAAMEMRGVLVDKDLLAELSDELLEQMKVLEEKSFDLIGKRINLNSPKQLSEVLFDELGVQPAMRRKTALGYSTDAAHLEMLVDQHELVEVVLEYRTVSKLRSTYTDALPKIENPATGRIHTHFNQTVASTGRLSSSAPNLQNIPVRTEQGRRIRRAFVPQPGWLMASFDYSQVELRLMAHMSGDEVLIEAFRLGQDIHARTAAEVFGVPLDAITKTQRNAGKTLNFALLYGMGLPRLARELGVDRREAKKFLERFEQRFVRVRAFFDELVQAATREGYVTTLYGRRRYIPELRSRQRHLQGLGTRLAMNTPIQGTAADLMKAAMIRVDQRLAEAALETRMLLQVHDELVFEVPPAELDTLVGLVRQAMEGVLRLKVKLKVDAAAGPNWADLERLEPT